VISRFDGIGYILEQAMFVSSLRKKPSSMGSIREFDTHSRFGALKQVRKGLFVWVGVK
jgi:hypothetical protein